MDLDYAGPQSFINTFSKLLLEFEWLVQTSSIQTFKPIILISGSGMDVHQYIVHSLIPKIPGYLKL